MTTDANHLKTADRIAAAFGKPGKFVQLSDEISGALEDAEDCGRQHLRAAVLEMLLTLRRHVHEIPKECLTHLNDAACELRRAAGITGEEIAEAESANVNKGSKP